MIPYRIFRRDSTEPAPVYTRIKVDGIRFFKCVFAKGSWQTYTYTSTIPYARLPTCHIQAIGKMAEVDGLWPIQGNDWMSREETFTIQPGTFTRIALEDSVRWCCTGVKDDERTDYVATKRLVAGQRLALSAGDNLLIVGGKLRVDDKLFGEQIHLRVGSAVKEVEAAELSYIFQWRTEDVRSRSRNT